VAGPGYLAVRIQVAWGDCDPAGIVFYPRFYAWMDVASHRLAREMGVPREAMQLPGRQMLGFPVVATRAEYLKPALVDDELEVRSWVARIGRSSFRLRHEIVRLSSGGTEELLVRGSDERVFIGRDEQGGLRPQELTTHLRDALARFADPIPSEAD
jgi:YbgC/YbaW family acyl-CoA thioester hydrolase